MSAIAMPLNIAPAFSPIARSIEQDYCKFRKLTESSIFLGGWQAELKNEIRAIAKECTYDDWDADGACAISDFTTNLALKFIDALPSNVIPPAVSPDNLGGYSFDWMETRDLIFTISLIEDRLAFARIIGGDKLSGEATFQNEIPEQIIQTLERFFKKRNSIWF